MKKMTKKNICVFCGASSGSTPDYHILAEKIGKMIGENNFIYLLKFSEGTILPTYATIPIDS